MLLCALTTNGDQELNDELSDHTEGYEGIAFKTISSQIFPRKDLIQVIHMME